MILPVLPLRDIVVFPHMIAPLFVGRKRSVNALESIMTGQSNEQKIILVTQKNSAIEEPTASDLYDIGTLVNLLQLLKLPDGTVKILVEGETRFKIDFIDIVEGQKSQEDYFSASGSVILEEGLKKYDPLELEALRKTVSEHFEQYVKMNKKIPIDIISIVNQVSDYSKFTDTIVSYFMLKLEQKQELLETFDIKKRLEKLLGFIDTELDVLQIQQRIRSRVKGQMEKSQRDYYLHEQLKAIYQELHNGEGGLDEISEFEKRITEKKLTKEAKEKAQSEVRKLRTMNQTSAEAAVIRNYLDWLLNIPWSEVSALKKDLRRASRILSENHYGLEKVKERIIEFLAVQTRVEKLSGQILCLVGPPGVGKTSLGRSIAEATGREFYRISLGGVRDEAEIRGHRRTYIGSMPGKLIQAMRKVKMSNPLILLDELDKLGSDWRGDPTSALLEVLDPEQNKSFTDHYIEIAYDLSNVLFITTANTLNMPAPLLDRLELIRISGYTEEEKIEIAKRHLVPKQIKAHGLKKEEIDFNDESILEIIRHYTRESGVRNLERELARICRKTVLKISKSKKTENIHISKKEVQKFCGVQRFSFGIKHEKDDIGVTNGLAWTETGGELLKIEAVVLKGSGKTLLTGKLGDVMQESIQAAISFIRSQAVKLKIKGEFWKDCDIHVHVPEGATPKDGPSAGIGMLVAITSALTKKAVPKDIAMTGEITLAGRVLAIGGLKEKLLAARRGGIKTVFIPQENKKDLVEIPKNVIEDIKIVPLKEAVDIIPRVFGV